MDDRSDVADAGTRPTAPDTPELTVGDGVLGTVIGAISSNPNFDAVAVGLKIRPAVWESAVAALSHAATIGQLLDRGPTGAKVKANAARLVAEPEPADWVIRSDGASAGNPGPIGAGIALFDQNGTAFVRGWAWRPGGTNAAFVGTNNEAELLAFLQALSLAAQVAGEPARARIRIECDSELVVQYLGGTWEIKEPTLARLAVAAATLRAKLVAAGLTLTLRWIPREENREADYFSRQALHRPPDRFSPRVAELRCALCEAGAAEDQVARFCDNLRPELVAEGLIDAITAGGIDRDRAEAAYAKLMALYDPAPQVGSRVPA